MLRQLGISGIPPPKNKEKHAEIIRTANGLDDQFVLQYCMEKKSYLKKNYLKKINRKKSPLEIPYKPPKLY